MTLQNPFLLFRRRSSWHCGGGFAGIGPVATIAYLLPITYALAPTSALIMLAGILLRCAVRRLHDKPSSSICRARRSCGRTCVDGHQMARQGRAGPGSCNCCHCLLRQQATASQRSFVRSWPHLLHYRETVWSGGVFPLMVLGLIGAVVIAHRSVLKAIGHGHRRANSGACGHRRELVGAHRFVFGVTGAL